MKRIVHGLMYAGFVLVIFAAPTNSVALFFGGIALFVVGVFLSQLQFERETQRLHDEIIRKEMHDYLTGKNRTPYGY